MKLRSASLIGFFILSACGKPIDMAGLEGPVPRTSEWPFGDKSNVTFRSFESGKTANLRALEITNAAPVPRFRQDYFDGSYSTGEIWFDTNERSQRVGIARRFLTHSPDGKTVETFKELSVHYAVYDELPNRSPTKIKLSIAYCPYTRYDEKNPEAESVPKHACQAKNAELTWALINQYPDMLIEPQTLEMVSPR